MRWGGGARAGRAEAPAAVAPSARFSQPGPRHTRFIFSSTPAMIPCAKNLFSSLFIRTSSLPQAAAHDRAPEPAP